ncbi:MAG TPA: ABC transporter ATP-binding protein [Usitatibacter sp.]|nr:ABC transporter ATP-binding protein [Usitatibacter sp.]
MAQYVYTMIRVGKVVPPKRQILKNISLSFHPGAKIGLLGLNGAGKSSVLKIMAGVDKDYEGEAHPMPNIRIGYLPQEPQLEPGHTVREAVEEGLGEVFQAKKRLEQVYAEYAEADADFDKLASEQEKLEKLLASADSDTLDTQLEVAADALRLPPWDAKVDVLSGGEKRRVALCRLLLSKPDMLLLDEPTNHLDAESVEWLEQKRDRLQKEESSESARQKAIKRELEWVRRNAKGQQTKNTARLKRFEELNDYEYQKRNETAEIFIPVAERLGNEVIEFENVSKGYGDRLLIDNLSFKIPPGAIVGIIGPNGAGKSTLFRMITGKEKPDKGKITIGHTVKLSVVDQTRKFPEKKNVWEAISNGQDILAIGKFEIQSRAYLGRFNFRGQDQQKLVGNLSGGERGRLHLAKTLLDGGNVLLLDEPSNDLDVETLRALEDALQEFAGTVLVISHDRWFLDRICTHILAAEGDSQWTFYQGNYHEYEEDKHERLGDEAAAPHRIRFKALK